MNLPTEATCLADVLRALEAFHAPLVHFGQTVFWDEPTKALLLPTMREAGVSLPVWAGVHDTDYFSKLPPAPGLEGPAAVLPANDGTTRDLWAAAGECAIPFGGEHRVTLRFLSRHGVPVSRLIELTPGGREAFIETYTEAYGWRGLARIGGEDITARDVLTREIGEYLQELLRWALQGSLDMVADVETRLTAEHYASRMLRRLDLAVQAHADESLTECFRTILGHVIGQLAGGRPDALTITASSIEMRFNRATCGRRRFEPLEPFLDPATRDAARQAYDRAVAHTGIYSLDDFGEGALPFDLVVPGRGRGSLRCTRTEAYVDLPEGSVMLGSARGLTKREQLAALVVRRFGPDCALVGKALVFPLMLLSETVMVLAETGSAYVSTGTRRLAEGLRDAGIRLTTHPVLRLRYHTFSSMGAMDCELALPEHLADAFGQTHITSREFAERWHDVVAQARSVLERLRECPGPGAVLEIMAAKGPKHAERLRKHECVRRRMREHGRVLAHMSGELRSLAAEAKELGRRVRELEAQSGSIRRERLKPLWAALDNTSSPEIRDALQREIDALEVERGALQGSIQDLKLKAHEMGQQWGRQRRAIVSEQRTGLSSVIHDETHVIEDAAAWERLRLVRSAYLTTQLEAADRRPSGWWFPLLSRQTGAGEWYAEVSRRTEGWLEILCEEFLPETGGSESTEEPGL